MTKEEALKDIEHYKELLQGAKAIDVEPFTSYTNFYKKDNSKSAKHARTNFKRNPHSQY